MKYIEPYAKLLRPLSKHFTKVFIKFNMSANQVTLLQIAFGINAAVLFGMGYFILGCIYLQIGFILDLCDGEIARRTNTESKAGEYLDLIGHRIVIPLYFFGLGLGTGNIMAGFIAGLFSQKFVNIGESGTQKQGFKWFFLYPGSMNVITIGAIFGLLPYIIIIYGIAIPIGRLFQIYKTFKKME